MTSYVGFDKVIPIMGCVGSIMGGSGVTRMKL